MRAAKPTKLLSLTLTPLLALVVLSGLAFSASPAFAEFGVQRAAVSARTQEGTPAVQAGSHPYSLTTTVIFNEPSRPETVEGNAKDVIVELPPGLIGNPTATPRCSYATFVAKNAGSKCSNDTVIGIAMTYVTTQLHEEYGATSNPVYNLTPAPGEAAQFGYLATGDIPILLGSTVRTGSDYGVTVDAPSIPETAVLAASKVTIWGVPADPSHNPWRGSCLSPVLGGAEPNIEYPGQGLDGGEAEQEGPLYKQGESSPLEGAPTSTGVCPSSAPVAPLLTMPTSCGRPLSAAVSADSWEEQGKFHKAKLELPEMMGCESLALDPKLTVTPDKPDASLSSGLAVNVKVPQEGTLSADGLSEADVRDTTVVLPPGVALNPSSANGLEACSEALVGFEASRGPNANGFEEPPLEPGVSVPVFSPTLPGGSIALFSGETALFEAGVNFCPNASKIGTVRIKLAVLEHPLEGAIYLAAQEANPFGSVMAIYLVAEDPVSGVLVKLPGEVTLCKSVGEDPVNATGEPIPGVTCQAVGQVVTTLLNTPQAPFEEFEAHFFGGEKAPLATPAHCGTYTTNSSLVSWGGETKHPSASMEITNGPNGGACPGSSLPFSPGLTGGALNVDAGAFSPFTLTMNRSDGEQNMQSVEAHLPPGLSGILANIELCPEPQANLGECGPNSLIGETTISVGVGGDPYTVTGGKFYLTGPYNGTGACTVGQAGCAPFGVTFAIPAKAGPFDLAHTKSFSPPCDCIVVRGKIEVNPITAALTVTSNPPGTPDAIPTSIEGVPLEIQHINATTTRSNFQFNPTHCSKMAVTGTIDSSEGGTDTIGVPFQVTNCQALKFEPSISVATAGKASKADGASLSFKIAYPKGALGSDAWFDEAKFTLPIQLPARLTTLQKACLEATFKANPESCPTASKVGNAVVHTQVLPVPLEGPVYFVSYGGAKFPEAVLVLKGDGVTIDLHGETFIAKNGRTSATFSNTPDVPFENIEVSIPTGPYSEFGTNIPAKDNYDLCGQNLVMPTLFKASNGLEISQNTHIAITGCAPAITVLSHKVKGETATIQVSVPAAGKLVATGKGLSKASRTATGAATLTVRLTLTNGEAATLSKHKGRKLKAKINLTFTPKKGGQLKTTTTVLIG